jgi:hypothetical protein
LLKYLSDIMLARQLMLVMLAVCVCLRDGATSSFGGKEGAVMMLQSTNLDPFRVALCITGQLKRIELDSKIKNLIRHSTEDGAIVDVFFVLERSDDTNKAKFSNKNTVHGDKPCSINGNRTDAVEDDKIVELIKEETKAWYKGGVFESHKEHLVSALTEWKHYRADLEGQNERQDRMRLHVSQFANVRRCAQLVEAHELTVRTFYDAVVRIRDNTLVVLPYSVKPSVLRYPDAVQVKRCHGEGGLNDKVLVLPRKHMDVAMRGWVEDWYLQPKGWGGRDSGNSEQVLRSVLRNHKVPVEKVPIQDMPFVDGRCGGDGTFCMVNNRKDCRPDEQTQPWQSLYHKSHPLSVCAESGPNEEQQPEIVARMRKNGYTGAMKLKNGKPREGGGAMYQGREAVDALLAARAAAIDSLGYSPMALEGWEWPSTLYQP